MNFSKWVALLVATLMMSVLMAVEPENTCEADSSKVETVTPINFERDEGEMLTKVAVSLAYATGLRLGNQYTSPNSKWMGFINLDAMTFLGYVNSIGVNLETPKPKRSGPYLVLSAGVEYIFVRSDFLNSESNDETNFQFSMFPLLHLTAGLGWQFKLKNGNWFYVEADTGIKNLLASLYLGMMF